MAWQEKKCACASVGAEPGLRTRAALIGPALSLPIGKQGLWAVMGLNG